MKKRKLLLSALILSAAGMIVGFLLYQGRIPLRTLACDGPVWQMRFSPDGRFMAALIRGKSISVWDTQSWKRTQKIPGVFDAYYFLPDNHTIVASRSYSTGTGPLAEKVNRGEGLTMSEWKQEEGMMQYRLQHLDIVTGRVAKTFVLPGQEVVEAAAPNVNRVALRRFAPKPGIIILDAEDGHEIHFLLTAPTATAAMSPDGRWLAVVDFSKPQGKPVIWDTRTWQSKTLQSSPGPNCADFSRDGQFMEASSARDVTVWRVSDWKQIGLFPTNFDEAGQSQFTWDSKQIVADGSWRNRQQDLPNTALMIWDVGTGRTVATLKHQYLIFWRLNSRGLVTLEVGTVKNVLWDTKTGRRLWDNPGGYSPEMTVAPDNHTLLTARLNSANENEGGIIEVRHLP